MAEKAEKGCLVIHGLTGTPVTMQPVIDELVGAGFVVNAPLLPGHGTSVQDLEKRNWQEWWLAVVEAYNDLQGEVKKVSCVGISLGSLLALKLAIEMKWGVRAVVAMGTPLVLDPLIEYLAYPLVKYSPVRWFYKYSMKDWEMSVADPDGRDFYMRNSYDRLPIHSVFEIIKMKKIIRSRMNEITSPVFIAHGREDKVAPFKNVNILKQSLNSNMVESLVLERSRHVISLDNDKEKVAKATVDFLSKFS